MSEGPEIGDGGNFYGNENEMSRCAPTKPAAPTTNHQPTLDSDISPLGNPWTADGTHGCRTQGNQQWEPTHQQPRMMGDASNTSVTSAHGHAANSTLKTVSLDRRQSTDWAMLDSGATSHCLMAAAPCTDKQETTAPIVITAGLPLE